MPCKYFPCNSGADAQKLKTWLASRSTSAGDETQRKVQAILDNVRQQRDQALVDYTRQYDCPDFHADMLTVSTWEIKAARASVAPDFFSILSEAAKNIRDFHQRQKTGSWIEPAANGTVLGQLVTPVQRAGLYVPGGRGGTTPLISSLLMTAIPAQVAGVEHIAIASPPQKNGQISPYILAAADMLGIETVYRLGSAWAIAALAIGTQSVAPVDVIAGPGNLFVATAKRLVMGEVGIDMIAGPSEIAILADASANPIWLAADMLSQAEHDPHASALLITDSRNILDQTKKELERQLESLPRAELAGKSLQDWGALIEVPSIPAGLELTNLLAPEHLQLCVENAWDFICGVKNAGAIFLGHFTPEAVGDYFAGPNHVLPTLGGARFSSALGVETFVKKTSLISTNADYIHAHGHKIAKMA
ncbi:MAG: histidinol dehydrogenase, partial [Deltaproteobacteria bacterium]